MKKTENYLSLVKPVASIPLIPKLNPLTPIASSSSSDTSKGQGQIQNNPQDPILKAIEDENKDCLKIEKSLEDVTNLFKLVQSLVHEQGNVIDDIEKNVEKATANLDHAVDDLKTARMLKKNKGSCFKTMRC